MHQGLAADACCSFCYGVVCSLAVAYRGRLEERQGERDRGERDRERETGRERQGERGRERDREREGEIKGTMVDGLNLRLAGKHP